MKRYQYSVVSLVIFYALFFYGSTALVAGRKVVDLQPFFSILIVLLPLSLLLMPFAKRYLNYVSFGSGLGLYILLTLINRANLNFTDNHTVLSLVIEVFCLLTILFLINTLAHQNEILENLLESYITPPTQHRLLRIAEDQSTIDDEFYRGRRFGYPVSTMVLSFGHAADEVSKNPVFQFMLDDLQDWIKQRYVYYRFSKLMGSMIRKSDLIVQMEEKNKLLLICPDTPAENLPVLASKIQNKFKEKLDVDVICGTASFPDDGSTFRALMSKADAELESSYQSTAD
jgi:hypothetical protein